ncbi:MAG: hypothetical protein K5894_09770 [Lachnospiraceae bacterium]|nr:hypothetical protein [Lachnospiraceae bacterium]
MGNLIFNFTGLYEKMNLELPDRNFIDFTKLTGSELYVDENAERIIRKEIRKYGADGIHMLDNGNYHYLTRLFLHELNEPFDLLYFDNHSDDQPPAFEGLKSCGSWVLDTRNELREKLGAVFWADGNSFIHKYGEMSSERPLYISVDKDVFDKKIAPTNWDQGNMAFEGFTDILNDLSSGRRIAGVDICGECAPTDGFFNSEELRINEETDMRLIRVFNILTKVSD